MARLQPVPDLRGDAAPARGAVDPARRARHHRGRRDDRRRRPLLSRFRCPSPTTRSPAAPSPRSGPGSTTSSRIGLDYLTLDRPARTLSAGESRRVALTSALGSGLVNTLYVLDEPSIGLHPRDVGRLIEVVRGLVDAGNSLVVVEHDEDIIRAGRPPRRHRPRRGAGGGPRRLRGDAGRDRERRPNRSTGSFLAGRLKVDIPKTRRTPTGEIRLLGSERPQPEGHRRHDPARRPLRRDGRQRLGQEHARRGDAVSGPPPPARERAAPLAAVPRADDRRQARRRRPRRPVPDRPLPALEPGDVPQGASTRSARRSPRPTRRRPASTPRAPSASTSTAAAARTARATASSSSTCNSSPT